jgi:hypothetical protein
MYPTPKVATTDTTTQKMSTSIEHRFDVIIAEINHQCECNLHFDNHISSLEVTTLNIDQKMDRLLDHYASSVPSSKLQKLSSTPACEASQHPGHPSALQQNQDHSYMANLHRINLTGASNNDLPSPFLKPNIPQRHSNSQYFSNHQDNYFRSHHLTPTITNPLLSKSSSVYSQHHTITTSSIEQAYNTPSLLIQCSSHPLDSSISPQDICMIQSSFFRACHSCDGQLLSHNAIPIPSINNNSFVNLLTFHSPIDDSIIHHILDILYQTTPPINF